MSKDELDAFSVEKEFEVDEKLKKRNAKEQIKINKQLANIEEIQKLIDCFKLNKNNFQSDYTNVLSFGGFSNYYLKRLFEAKILEL
ncbi:MAG: hypothetical protein PHY80_04265, partial [Rickettsiales bacterium]|nr:hypothetical protein [Rickettsiales bacterium]